MPQHRLCYGVNDAVVHWQIALVDRFDARKDRRLVDNGFTKSRPVLGHEPPSSSRPSERCNALPNLVRSR